MLLYTAFCDFFEVADTRMYMFDLASFTAQHPAYSLRGHLSTERSQTRSAYLQMMGSMIMEIRAAPMTEV